MTNFDENSFFKSEFWKLFFQGDLDKLSELGKENQNQTEGNFWYAFTSKDESIRKQLELWEDKSGKDEFRFWGFYELAKLDKLEADKLERPIYEYTTLLDKSEHVEFDFLKISTETRIGYVYLWQGNLDKAKQFLDRSLSRYESSSLKGLPRFYCGFRLFAELAQLNRHKGDFSKSIKNINQSLNLVEKCQNHIMIVWVLMVKIGISTESMLNISNKDEIDTIRDMIKHDLDRIESIEQAIGSSKLGISRCLQVAKYQYFKSSRRNRVRVDAERIIEDILKDPLQHWIHKIDARQHLADLLVEEYRLYEEREIFDEIKNHLKLVEKNANENQSLLFLVKARIILAKLLEIDGKQDEAKSIYHDTLEIADKNQLGMLAKLIKQEEQRFYNNLERMQQLIEENASVTERMKLNKIQEYINIAKRIADESN